MSSGSINGFFGEYRWLSNFTPVNITYEGQYYPSTEHAYQAAKAVEPDDKKAIALAKSPGMAKRVGQGIRIRPDWHHVKHEIMLNINRLKYQDEELARRLLETGDAYIEETNTWGDTYWGVCNGLGLNNLGEILMYIRSELQDEQDIL